MTDSLNILTDSITKTATSAAIDTLNKPVEGIERTASMSYSSWIAVDILLVAAVMFILIYKQRQFLAFKIREFFSSDNRFFSTHSFSGTSKWGAISIMLLLMANSTGLVVSGIANLYPHLFNMMSAESVYDISGLMLTMKVTGMVIIFVLLKALIYAVVNWLFFRHDENAKWMQAYFFVTAAFVFIIFPFALTELFVGLSEQILTFGLAILFIAYEILVLYKLIVNFKAKNYGILLIFLYFCTVEALPALFVWKNIH
jgi:hypothetical protein